MITRERAQEIIGSFEGKRILVVGDLMLDRYVSGTVSRISPEAPVPVVKVTGDSALPGGAANVALNIQSMGGQAVVVGIVGKDEAGSDLVKILSNAGILTDGVVEDDGVTTTVKTRVMADRQQVVRVDRENGSNDLSGVMDDVCGRIQKLAPDVAGVIIEDYGKGMITQQLVDAALAAASGNDVPVGFDPKQNHELNVSGITLATPNYSEACSAAGMPETSLSDDSNGDGTVAEVGAKLMAKWEAGFLLVTLGSHGMAVFDKGSEPLRIPTRAQEVFDVSGAGDTVIAVSLLALACGATSVEAASLANFAAGVVVGKLGTAVVTGDELLAAMGEG